MPIYAYQCSACGHSMEALQKMADAPLTDCPACGAAAFGKESDGGGFSFKWRRLV